ncbi:MAG TPA: hypothetical protein VFW48_02295, partial [Solirubrobacterales bacterium]|nr:hypothetical protein [Solirubrobacterales bacterium]
NMKWSFGTQRIPSGRRRAVRFFDLGTLAAVVLALSVSVGGAAAAGTDGGTGTAEAAPCVLPKALVKAKEDKAARKAYVKELAVDPGSKCALDGLKALNAPAAEPAAGSCKIGNAFLDVHREDDAIAAYKKGLEANPGSDCASDGLDEAGPGWFKRTADCVLDAIPTFLVWVGLLLLACLLILLIAYWPRAKRKMQTARLVGPLIGRVLRPRLTFETIADDCVEGKPGPPIVARIKELLAKMRDEAVAKVPLEYDLDFGTPGEEFADLVSADKGLKSSLDNASDISEQTKLVAAVLGLVYSLLPIQRFEISGCLEPPQDSAASASLLLEEDTQRRAGTTVKRTVKSATPGAAEYMTLVEPAAVWIQFEVARAIEGKAPDARAAESWALLDEGLRLYRLGELADAREAYERALLADSRNWAVYVSLAVAEARSATDFEAAMKRTLEALKKMEEESND